MRVHGPALATAFAEVLASGRFIGGPVVEQLEARLAQRVGVPHAIACNSGTDAEQLLLMALEIGRGDEVIVPDFTFMATAEAVALAGATPVCVDVDPETFTLDPVAVRRAMGPRVRAIVPVSLFGHPAALDELEQLAALHGVELLEDACQSFGARWHDRPSGAFGRASFTSFYPSKPLGGLGDGGMVFTRDAQLAAKLRSLRDHGHAGPHLHHLLGMNSRLDALQAAALLVKLSTFDRELQARRDVAERYDQALRGALITPRCAPGAFAIYAQYTARVAHAAQRSPLIEHLRSLGIPTAVHYPRPLHAQPSLVGVLQRTTPTPVAEALAGTVVSLPMSSYLSLADQERVIAGVLSWSQALRTATGA
jgi:UDP-2-acetamido-2-deoxy-ribo-hexuluronate aminotransferase